MPVKIGSLFEPEKVIEAIEKAIIHFIENGGLNNIEVETNTESLAGMSIVKD